MYFSLITSTSCQPCQTLKAKINQLGLSDEVEILDVADNKARELITQHGLRRVPACLIDNVPVDQDKFMEELQNV